MSLTEAMLRARLTTIRSRLEREGTSKRCIGVIGDGYVGPAEVRVDGDSFRVVFCPSPLAVREQMDGVASEGPRLVIVTDCAPQELGADVRARVFRNEFQPISPWQTVCDLFQVDRIRPDVPLEPWLLDELLAVSEPRPVLASRELDLDTIKDVVLRRLGFAHGRPDVRDLLEWASGAEAAGWRARADGLRVTLRQWIVDSAGKAGGAVLDCVQAGHGELAWPLGLVLGALRSDVGSSEQQRVGLARAERYVGDRHLVEQELGPWVQAAEGLLQPYLVPGEFARCVPVLDSADQILASLKVEELAATSRFLRAGLRQRERAFAEALDDALRSRSKDLVSVERTAKAVADHALAAFERGRFVAAAVTMAVRLLRWLRTEPAAEAPQTFRDAALRYAAEGCFVDWAREQTALGHPEASLQQGLRALWSKVLARRQAENERFGQLCARWNAAPTASDDLIPLETVLEHVLGPLAAQGPVLLLVLDGMSLSIFHELADGLPRLGWTEVGPDAGDDRGLRRYGVAVLPTVTEVSRTSLLTGEIQRGGQDDELRGFAGHPALRHGADKPVLLHKNALSGDRVGVDDTVAQKVLGRTRVVGVVLNAIDDWLGKGDQDAAPWEVERIKAFVALLEHAANSGRTVVITSDHGHVREHDGIFAELADGTRYRSPGQAGLREGEVLVRGPRVCFGDGEVVLPWSESLRYAPAKQNGYHGGITPQEVLVPVAVFVRAGSESLAGYAPTPVSLPTWWESAEAPAALPAPPRKVAVRRRPAAVLPFGGQKQSWVETLLQSPLFVAQRELHQRGYPGDDKLQAILQALAERGDGMTVDALASRLSLARVRVQGMVVAARRVLNIDGAEGLEFDAESSTVRVNWDTLRLQFGLDQEKGT